MAEGYNADINVRVKVFDRELRRLEDRVQKLNKVVFDPKKSKEARAEAVVQEQRLQLLVKGVKAARDEAKVQQKLRAESVSAFRQQVQLRKEARAVQERQLRLSNAQALQEQRLVALNRTNARNTKSRAKAIEKLQGLSKDPQFAGDPRIQERVATALGRILALQRQIDKGVTKQTAQQRRLSSYNKQIEELRKIGVTEGQLRKAIKRRAEFTEAFSKKQDDIADRREAQLKNEIKLIQDKNTEQLKAFRRPARLGPSISSPIRGSVDILGSPKYKEAALRRRKKDSEELSRKTKAVEAASRKLSNLQQKLNKITSETNLKLQQVEFEEELKRIKAADAAQAKADKAKARREKEEFNRRLAEAARIKKLHQIASPIKGSASMEGSPAALQKLNAEEERLNRFAEAGRRLRQKASREDTKRTQARLRAAQKLIQLSSKAAKLASKIQTTIPEKLALPSTELLKPEKRGIKILDAFDRDKENRIEKRLEANKKRNLKLQKEADSITKARLTALRKIAVERRKEGRELIRLTQRQLTLNNLNKERVRLLGPGSPQGQANFFRSRQRQAEAAQRQRSRLREDILLGAGFPLLTGGGPGAVLGGLGGALIGGGRGGFGGQIFGSAIGQQLDVIVGEALNAATALTSTAGALDFVREKSLFSSEKTKELAYNLEKQGDVAGLASLLTDELARSIGNEGVQSLVDLGKTTNETTKLWNQLTLQLQALISGPLNGFLSLVNSFLGGITTDLRYSAAKQSLANDPAALARFNEIEREVRGTTSKNVRGSAFNTGTEDVLNPLTGAKQETVLKRAAEEGLLKTAPIIPRTAEDRRTITGDVSAAREAQRIRERIEKLRLERQEIAKITEFKDRIAAAEAVKDKLTVRRIQGEQRVYELQQRQLEQLIGVTDQQERAEIILTSAAEIQAARKDTERDLNTLQRERRENFDQTLQGLQNQLDIAVATTRQEEERLRIAYEMQTLKDSGDFSEDQLRQIQNMKKQLNAANQPLARFITDSQKQLNDLEQVAVNVSAGIGNAIGNSLNNGISQLIEGSATVKEVFADMLKSVGQVLVQEGTKMIATYIAIGIAKSFAGMPGFGEPGSFETGTGLTGFSSQSSFDATGLFSGLANGGPAKAGQPYLVGERGPELFVPSSNGGVMRNEDMRSLMGRSPAAANAPSMNFTFETTNIGGQEFVSREQLEAAMATTRRQAANDGAKRGMNMTLDKMQNSPRTRSRIGIS